MKLTFLGASHGIPEPNRKCSCTMVEVGDRVYFVDMGVMAICELVNRGIPVERVRGIFITHMHGDHTNGLLHFADLISWYYTGANPEICLPLIEGAKIITDWIALSCHATRELNYRAVQAGTLYDDGFLTVRAARTEHTAHSYAYRLEADGKAVLFTGDLRKPSVDFPLSLAENTDLTVCEGAHFPATEYAPIFAQYQPKRVIVNHHAPWNMPHIQKLAEELPQLHVTAAHDGLETVL